MDVRHIFLDGRPAGPATASPVPRTPGGPGRRQAASERYEHHHRKRSQVCDGDGAGAAPDGDGAAVGVDPESGSDEAVGPDVSPDFPGRVADWRPLSGLGVAVPLDGDSDADGEAEGLGEDEASPPSRPVRSSRGWADALGSVSDPSASDDSPPAAAG
ncbi:hypothetical protein ACIBAH_03190 [Streptomyces sp. NPDC051445]|uniref:hypothetical protein n=1 Tax=Streptomyces sp. NPDC051445 TaxID=3365653 RepID=UPI0037A2B2D1